MGKGTFVQFREGYQKAPRSFSTTDQIINHTDPCCSTITLQIDREGPFLSPLKLEIVHVEHIYFKFTEYSYHAWMLDKVWHKYKNISQSSSSNLSQL